MARLVVALALALSLGACGRGGDRAAVRDVVEGYIADSGRPAAITRIDVDVEGAVAELSDGQAVFLSHTVNGWELAAYGCEASSGPPTRYPMNCEAGA